MTRAEKLTIAQGICAPLLRKIRADLQRNAMEMEDDDEEDQTVNRLDPRLDGTIKEFQGLKALFFVFTSIPCPGGYLLFAMTFPMHHITKQLCQ